MVKQSTVMMQSQHLLEMAEKMTEMAGNMADISIKMDRACPPDGSVKQGLHAEAQNDLDHFRQKLDVFCQRYRVYTRPVRKPVDRNHGEESSFEKIRKNRSTKSSRPRKPAKKYSAK